MNLLHKLWLAVFFVGLGTAGALTITCDNYAPAFAVLMLDLVILSGLFMHCWATADDNVVAVNLDEGLFHRETIIERDVFRESLHTMRFINVVGRVRADLNITEDEELHIDYVPYVPQMPR